MPPDRSPRAFKPRLDMTLVAFAIAGMAVAALQPARPPSAASGDRYALAISHGEDLKLAATAVRRTAGIPVGASTTTPSGRGADAALEPGTRVLACRRVISVGPLDLGARCKPADAANAGRGAASLVQANAVAD
ncbi:MAG: hypothetical protein ABL907_23560 [Hyphomicrobium sp.]